MALFPVVPNVPGVPAVPRLPGAAIPAQPVLLVADAVSVIQSIAGLFGTNWGVFDSNGVQVVGQDVNSILNVVSGIGTGNVLDLDFKASWTIPEYPVEQGGFQSYNKVQRPYDVALTVTAGGSNANRQLLLDQVIAIIGSTDLYTVGMPEMPIAGVNPIGYGFSRRHDHGLGLLMITMLFKQVRPGGNPQFSTTGTPASTAAASPTTGGAAPITSPTTPFAASTSQVQTGQVSPVQPSSPIPVQVQ
jgi:hypothetical protein